jgi:hypothetical protein
MILLGLLLFWIPSLILGLLTGIYSAWWILAYLFWILRCFDGYAELVNRGRLGAPGPVIFFADIFVFVASAIISWLIHSAFSFS